MSVKALIIGANIDISLPRLPSYLHIICVSKDFKQQHFKDKCVIHNVQVLHNCMFYLSVIVMIPEYSHITVAQHIKLIHHDIHKIIPAIDKVTK